MPRLPSGALFCAPFLSACLAGHAASSAASPQAREQADRPGELRVEAQRSLEGGEIERARALLDEILIHDHLTRAGAALEAGTPEEALDAVDQALGLAPENPEAQLLKADASLRLAEARMQAGGGSAGLIEGALTDALDFYKNTHESAHSLLGASRAAWLLGDAPAALDFARRAQALRAPDETSVAGLGVSAERIYAEQVWYAYSTARAAESDEVSALANECEDALGRLLGRASGDPWAWARLSDLYEGEGELASARGASERGLKRTPADAGLLERLARVNRALEGSAATVKTLEAYVGAHPEVPAARWQLALTRFQLALDGSKAEAPALDPAPFLVAEADFRGLRAEAPEFTQLALGYEVACRLACGWCAFRADDLPRARAEFESMNEVLERGIEWSYPGEFESGIQGLFRIADAHAAREEILAAGEVFEELHALQPDSVQWANNAGLMLRDAAVALERESMSLCSAADGRLTNREALQELRALAGIDSAPAGSSDEAAAFARAADERGARAREIMERSWKAYRPAAELAPEDIRVVNDAALVLVYYLHHDLDWAEQALLRCVELGGPQVEAKRAALATEEAPERAAALETELALLTEAWGDAHQNLGVLAWLYKKDGASARTWLEKSLEIGPERPPVTNSLLPQIRGERTPQEDDYWDLLNWAQPCRM